MMLSKLIDSTYYSPPQTPNQPIREYEPDAPKKPRRKSEPETPEKGRYFVFFALLFLVICLLFKGDKMLAIAFSLFDVLFLLLTRKKPNPVRRKLF